MDSYKVGLHNVGSYLASGRPWLKNFAINPGETVPVNFSNVSRSINIKNKSQSGSLKIAFANFESDEKSRAIDFNGTGSGINYTSSAINLASGNEYSFSFWVNLVELGETQRLRIFSTSTSNFNRVDAAGIDDSRIGFYFYINGVNQFGSIEVPSRSQLLSDGGDLWAHIVIISDGLNDSSLYVNGELLITNSAAMHSPAVDRIYLPASGVSYGGSYDELTYWDTKLTDSQIVELKNTGDYYDPRTHSAQANLVGWWAFEDSNSSTEFNNDINTTIQDRVGSNNLTGPGDITFVDSPFSLSAVESNRHYITLKAGSEITLNCKAKRFYLKAGLDFTQDVEIFASLTNIPSQRMYELTGPGIDE